MGVGAIPGEGEMRVLRGVSGGIRGTLVEDSDTPLVIRVTLVTLAPLATLATLATLAIRILVRVRGGDGREATPATWGEVQEVRHPCAKGDGGGLSSCRLMRPRRRTPYCVVTRVTRWKCVLPRGSAVWCDSLTA